MKNHWQTAFLLLAIQFILQMAIAGPLNSDDVLSIESLRPNGQWEEAIVPGTLDLADRARLAINAMTRLVDPANNYKQFQNTYFCENPIRFAVPSQHNIYLARSLPMARLMSGSNQNLEVELALIRPALSNPEIVSILYEFDHNPRWIDWIENYRKNIPAAYAKSIIRVEDRAFTPPWASLNPDGTWNNVETRGKSFLPYSAPDEPISDQQTFEGTVKGCQDEILSQLVSCYRHTRDAQAGDLIERMTRFIMKPGMWEDTWKEGFPGNEHGIWAGHWYGNMTTLCTLLNIANMKNDDRLKQIVREAYDHARHYMVTRCGWTPMWLTPLKFGRPDFEDSETCGTAYTLILAAKLSDSGLGDYWDDVDWIVRNHLIESQVIQEPHAASMLDSHDIHPEDMKSDFARCIGGFGGTKATTHDPEIWGCCTGNSPVALYCAWEGITRFDEKSGVATVNLFLNRAATWMDVNSWLPYEGKVEFRNKQAKALMVRIPVWVPIDQLKAYVNDQPVEAARSGRYLLFLNLNQGNTIRLEFPVPEFHDRYSIHKKEYMITFRGSTVVDISPRSENESEPPIFAREGMKAVKAPMRSIKRFVPDHVISVP